MGVMAGHAGVHKLQFIVKQFPFLPPASLAWELVGRESRGRSPREGHLLVPWLPQGKVFHPQSKWEVAKGSFKLGVLLKAH